MKKFLLSITGIAAVALSGAAAVQTQTFEEWDCMPLNAISDNGKWAVGNYGNAYLTVYNLEEGNWEYYDYDDLGFTCLAPGSGRIVADDGTICLSTSYSFEPFYLFKDGELIELSTKSSSILYTLKGGFNNSITPDGKYVVGLGYSSNYMGDGKSPGTLPVMHVKDSSTGEYGNCQILPYPSVDAWGNVPQGVNAQCISADGSTVGICVTSSWGGFDTEVGYAKLNSEGKYEFHWLGYDLYRKEGMEFPSPMTVPYPEYANYMTSEQYLAYTDDCSKWTLEFQSTGVLPEWSYPVKTDYMTEEMAAQWTADYTAYNEDVERYKAELAAIDAWINEEVAKGTMAQFVLNCLVMSSNGRWIAANSVTGQSSAEYDNAIYLFDLENDGAWTRIKPDGMWGIYALSISDDGIMTFVDNLHYELVQNSYTYNISTGEVLPFHEWMLAQDADTYAWMEREMKHTFTGYLCEWVDELGGYWDWHAQSYDNDWVTGEIFMTPDRSVIAGYSLNFWNDGSDGSEVPVAYNYVLAGNHAGIDTVTVSATNDDATPEYFTLQGIRVNAPQSGQLVIERRGNEARKVIITE